MEQKEEGRYLVGFFPSVRGASVTESDLTDLIKRERSMTLEGWPVDGGLSWWTWCLITGGKRHKSAFITYCK